MSHGHVYACITTARHQPYVPTAGAAPAAVVAAAEALAFPAAGQPAWQPGAAHLLSQSLWRQREQQRRIRGYPLVGQAAGWVCHLRRLQQLGEDFVGAPLLRLLGGLGCRRRRVPKSARLRRWRRVGSGRWRHACCCCCCCSPGPLERRHGSGTLSRLFAWQRAPLARPCHCLLLRLLLELPLVGRRCSVRRAPPHDALLLPPLAHLLPLLGTLLLLPLPLPPCPLHLLPPLLPQLLLVPVLTWRRGPAHALLGV